MGLERNLFILDSQDNACKQIGLWTACYNANVNHNTSQYCLAVAMASYCASSKENSNAYTFIIFKPCPYNMALFLKMKSINESEIQESTSPCASHVHIQHLENTQHLLLTDIYRDPNVREEHSSSGHWLINTLTMDGYMLIVDIARTSVMVNVQTSSLALKWLNLKG